MKATVKLYKNDGETDLGFPVKIILSHERKTRRKTIGYAFASDWDLETGLPKQSHDDYEDLYSVVWEVKKRAAKMEFREMDDFSEAFEFLNNKKRIQIKDFYNWAESCVALMEKQERKGNAASYQNSIDAFKRFAPHLDFKELTPTLLNSFKIFAKGRGNSNKTIRHYGIGLRAIYNRAVKAGIIEDKKPFLGFFTDIPTRDRRKKNRYLDFLDIEKLETAILPPGQRRDVDLSLLQFYLGGADLIDIYYLKNTDVGKRVFLTRRKLGEKAYEFDVLLPEKAKLIIEKYRVPGEYVFPWRKDYEGYKTFYSNHKRSLAKVQEKLEIVLQPKNENLTSKVMRHTFATMGKFARIEEDLLRELMGHERNEIDTVYKDKYPEAERDAAQLAIIGEKTKKKTARKVKMRR
ncbi:MAG TPA: site-specific integrase [Salinimicrobium sp.]|nr:site-specific integrase [Salinimicrobium sp.]